MWKCHLLQRVHLGTITTKYNFGNDTTKIELTIIRKDCSDGMSEETHPYGVALVINKTKYSGCGRKGN